jgi:hypothetical protein
LAFYDDIDREKRATRSVYIESEEHRYKLDLCEENYTTIIFPLLKAATKVAQPKSTNIKVKPNKDDQPKSPTYPWSTNEVRIAKIYFRNKGEKVPQALLKKEKMQEWERAGRPHEILKEGM